MVEEARAEERHEHADRRRAQARYSNLYSLGGCVGHSGTVHAHTISQTCSYREASLPPREV